MFSVIFDMDGTLVDTQRICIPAWDYAGEEQNFKDVGTNSIAKVCGMNEKGWTNYLYENYPTMDVKRFSESMRKYIIDNLVVRYKQGAEELLKFLKSNGIKIGLASGSSLQTINHHLHEVGGTHYFDAIAGGLEVKNGKPAPDVFLLCAERLGVNPEDCFVFEDSENGIIAGYNAKMKCIGVPDLVPFGENVKGKMFAELKTLDEAIDIFKKLL